MRPLRGLLLLLQAGLGELRPWLDLSTRCQWLDADLYATTTERIARRLTPSGTGAAGETRAEGEAQVRCRQRRDWGDFRSTYQQSFWYRQVPGRRRNRGRRGAVAAAGAAGRPRPPSFARGLWLRQGPRRRP